MKSGTMSLLLLVGVYFLYGFFLAAFRAWKIGKHYATHAGGERNMSCQHWACDIMAKEFLAVILIGWPVIYPIFWVCGFFNLLMRVPYQRSLPPEHEAPGRVVKSVERPYDSH